MSELRVRDHSQPCKHSERNESGRVPQFLHDGLWLCDLCPGGKEIVLRVEVAGKVTYYEGEVVEE